MVVHHFGPDPATVGGMATVIRVHTEHQVGGDVVDSHSTWKPQAPLMTVRLFAASARALLRVPAGERAPTSCLARGNSWLNDAGGCRGGARGGRAGGGGRLAEAWVSRFGAAVGEGAVATKPIKPGLADWERLLTVNRLQTQAARSVALDGGALGVMAVAAAVAAIVIGVRGAYGLWILALALLGLSLGLAVRSLRLPGAKETGPSLADMRKARETEEDEHLLEDSLLDDLEEDLQTNDQALARKIRLFDRALIFLVLAILVELAGRVVQ